MHTRLQQPGRILGTNALQIFALSKFFVSRFMGREGQCLHPRGRHQGLNPGPHLPFPELGGHPSSPVSWVVRATVCTQGEALGFKGEALGIEPKTSSPISRAGRPPFNSRFIVKEGHRMHPRGETGD